MRAQVWEGHGVRVKYKLASHCGKHPLNFGGFEK